MKKKIKTLDEDYSYGWQQNVSVPKKWLDKALNAIEQMKKLYGKPIRFMHIGGAVAIAFRSAELILSCKYNASRIYRERLESELRK